MRRKIWAIIEEPDSSIKARIFAGVSVLFVLISIAGLILGSLSDLQVPGTNVNASGRLLSHTTTLPRSHTPINQTRLLDKNGNKLVEMEPHPYLVHVENMCIIWFVFEYVTKMLVSPNHCKTFCQVLNIIDLLAILPFICEMGLYLVGINAEQLRELKGALLVVRILR